MPRYAVIVMLDTDATPEAISSEIVSFIQDDPHAEVFSVVVVDDDANELYVFEKEKK